MPTATESLPLVDEHSLLIDVAPDAVWEALPRVIEGTFGSATTGRVARLLGCADVDTSGPRPLDAGSAFPGFHVEAAERGQELALAGSHRFSDYALIFHLEDAGDRGTRLGAETRAAFPGLKGSVYRMLVIGSGVHVLVTRRLLGAIKRRAERA
ncbi:MAG: hypothetical protein WA687_07150 [Solirubrobacterales bacterium]